MVPDAGCSASNVPPGMGTGGSIKLALSFAISLAKLFLVQYSTFSDTQCKVYISVYPREYKYHFVLPCKMTFIFYHTCRTNACVVQLRGKRLSLAKVLQD